jgi:hypothetical protein
MEKEGKLFPCSHDRAGSTLSRTGWIQSTQSPDTSLYTFHYCPHSTTQSFSSSIPLKRIGRFLKAVAKSDL